MIQGAAHGGKSFSITAGVRPDWWNKTAIWLRSPRTGKQIEVPGAWYKDLPVRVVSRIVKARSEGRAEVEFTRDELKAIAAVADKVLRIKAGRFPGGPNVHASRVARHVPTPFQLSAMSHVAGGAFPGCVAPLAFPLHSNAFTQGDFRWTTNRPSIPRPQF